MIDVRTIAEAVENFLINSHLFGILRTKAKGHEVNSAQVITFYSREGGGTFRITIERVS